MDPYDRPSLLGLRVLVPLHEVAILLFVLFLPCSLPVSSLSFSRDVLLRSSASHADESFSCICLSVFGRTGVDGDVDGQGQTQALLVCAERGPVLLR